jgi:NADPH:quinone reductase-like Zn-dependent oxidoreductase
VAQGPFDLILESVGGSSLAKAIELVGRQGVVVTIGNSSEQDTTFNARTLYAKGAQRASMAS